MEPDIDARGLKCPEPVIRTKRKIESACGPFSVLVDNPTARDNVQRFARKTDCDVRVTDHQDGFLVEITPGTFPAEPPAPGDGGEGTVIFITADGIGAGEGELGRTLMKMFLYALTERDEVPSTLAFANSGVRLVTENEETVAHVRSLEESGVEVLVCGTCLDFYGLKDSLKAGRVSNMYDILQAIIGASLLVSL